MGHETLPNPTKEPVSWYQLDEKKIMLHHKYDIYLYKTDLIVSLNHLMVS